MKEVLRLMCAGLLIFNYAATVHAEGAQDPCAKDVSPLLGKLFSSLGHDCQGYVTLFSSNAIYYHQHDGFKKYSDLLKNCKDYGALCPGNACKFLQNGDAMKVARGNRCYLLVPYLWSEIPANNKVKDNLEPHTGWEYIIASPDEGSQFNYRMNEFAEIESTYSVPFNPASPGDTPALVAQSTLKLLAKKNSASKGECNKPIAPTLTRYFNDKSMGGDTWQQQGDAVVLAAGGVCHVSVPYAAQVGSALKTGLIVFTLEPAKGITYKIDDSVEFPFINWPT